MAAPATITVTLPQIAKAIDHSLLHPAQTDSQIFSGLEAAKRLGVAAACRHANLADSDVLICAVVGFPHGSSTTRTKVLEAEEAVWRGGAHEVDVVINVGKVLGGDWERATNEIRAVNDAVVKRGAALKAIFETDLLNEEHIVHLCKVCSVIPAAFIKTSTGFGFVRQPDGFYASRGATVPHIQLMKANVAPNVLVKAAGGIRTLDDLLLAMAAGASRIGASATETILEEAVALGIGTVPVEIRLSSLFTYLYLPRF
ncbi:hypothetical protein F5B17DRAFT_438914 [Nemania serpens]|nr:hypothetical protein F5B17DRAFT_438914 [Nemania serpens]